MKQITLRPRTYTTAIRKTLDVIDKVAVEIESHNNVLTLKDCHDRVFSQRGLNFNIGAAVVGFYNLLDIKRDVDFSKLNIDDKTRSVINFDALPVFDFLFSDYHQIEIINNMFVVFFVDGDYLNVALSLPRINLIDELPYIVFSMSLLLEILSNFYALEAGHTILNVTTATLDLEGIGKYIEVSALGHRYPYIMTSIDLSSSRVADEMLLWFSIIEDFIAGHDIDFLSLEKLKSSVMADLAKSVFVLDDKLTRYEKKKIINSIGDRTIRFVTGVTTNV